MARPRTSGLGEGRDAGGSASPSQEHKMERLPALWGPRVAHPTFLPGQLTDPSLPDGRLATACQAGSWDRGFSTSQPQAVTPRPRDPCQPQASLRFPSATPGTVSFPQPP